MQLYYPTTWMESRLFSCTRFTVEHWILNDEQSTADCPVSQLLRSQSPNKCTKCDIDGWLSVIDIVGIISYEDNALFICARFCEIILCARLFVLIRRCDEVSICDIVYWSIKKVSSFRKRFISCFIFTFLFLLFVFSFFTQSRVFINSTHENYLNLNIKGTSQIWGSRSNIFNRPCVQWPPYLMRVCIS